ncbi:MAG: LysM peptidoglycan-binding domain-containing protein [Aerococcus sp.]|nr:LysM peptidoglycan-binding domain-containing protein [Aerococcus sp.]
MNHNWKKSLTAGATVLGSVCAIAAYQSFAATHEVSAAPNGATYDISNPFLNKIAGPASELAGQNDLYASVMMAQAVLETGWGSSQLSQEPYNNLFGIKGNYNGASVNFNTLEDDGTGNYYQINDGFRQYPSVRESLQDYVSLIRGGISGNPYFYSGVWKSNTTSYRDATAALTGRYATDTSYGSKLNSIIETYDLTRFDQGPVTVKPTPSNKQTNTTQGTQTPTGQRPQQSGRSYTVKAGDGLWTVAQALGMTIDQVKQANGLTSNLIFPGQILYAGSSQQQATSQAKPQQSAQTSRPSQSSSKSYTVKAGDGLWTVSRALGVSIDQVKRANGLTSDFIYPGQVLYAGGSQQQATSQAKPQQSVQASRPSQSSGNSYTVKAGDGLWTVSRALGVSIGQVKQANGLTSDFIYPGQVLYAGSGQQHQASQSIVNTQNAVSQLTTQSAANAGEYYTVKSGDTQWHIATTHGLTLQQFQALNGFTTANLYIGQRVRVSGKVLATPKPAGQSQAVAQQSTQMNQQQAKPSNSQTVSGGQYTVKAGDNLYRIAVNHGVSLDALLKANNFGSPSALIVPGQVLAIPAK